MMSAWMYLRFPDMYLHSLMTEGADADHPCVLLSEKQQVLQLTPSARNSGIQPGMSLASALLLCPALKIHTRDENYEKQLLTQRSLWACHYSALICPDSPQGLWLETGSMLRLFGGLKNYWLRIEEDCQKHCWPVHIATAHTPLAARWLALSGRGQPTLDTANLKVLLDQLSLEDIELPPQQLLALQRLGISTLAELRRLPLAETGRRISPDLMLQLQQLDGARHFPMTPFSPPLSFSDTAAFSHEVEYRNGLFFPLSRLVNSLSGFLHHHQLSVRWLDVSVQHRSQPQTQWQFHFARPEYRYNELLQLCRYQLERQQLNAPATALTLTAERFSQRDIEQTRLHASGSGQSASAQSDSGQRHRIDLLNRLHSRLNEDQIHKLQTTGDPRPEFAWQRVSSVRDHQASMPFRAGHWPLWLLTKPIAIPEPDLTPDTVIRGPLRIDSGWWESSQIRRDYYQLFDHQQLLWVFRNDRGAWFLHGYFS